MKNFRKLQLSGNRKMRRFLMEQNGTTYFASLLALINTLGNHYAGSLTPWQISKLYVGIAIFL